MSIDLRFQSFCTVAFNTVLKVSLEQVGDSCHFYGGNFPQIHKQLDKLLVVKLQELLS